MLNHKAQLRAIAERALKFSQQHILSVPNNGQIQQGINEIAQKRKNELFPAMMQAWQAAEGTVSEKDSMSFLQFLELRATLEVFNGSSGACGEISRAVIVAMIYGCCHSPDPVIQAAKISLFCSPGEANHAVAVITLPHGEGYTVDGDLNQGYVQRHGSILEITDPKNPFAKMNAQMDEEQREACYTRFDNQEFRTDLLQSVSHFFHAMPDHAKRDGFKPYTMLRHMALAGYLSPQDIATAQGPAEHPARQPSS